MIGVKKLTYTLDRIPDTMYRLGQLTKERTALERALCIPDLRTETLQRLIKS
jgi:hypothetical protein